MTRILLSIVVMLAGATLWGHGPTPHGAKATPPPQAGKIATLAEASEGKDYVLGTVTSKRGDHLIVRTRGGATVRVPISPTTPIIRGRCRGSASDPAPGRRVAVYLTEDRQSVKKIRLAPR